MLRRDVAERSGPRSPVGGPLALKSAGRQIAAIEVEKVTAHGQHLYIVAIYVDATPMMRG
jgi:hypothetical protein